MADFNALETLINAYIKQNGVQAITGQVLNGVLRGMVSALGKGWTIAGAAEPNTDPGTMTGPVAYIAHTAGTYTDFGGLVVNDGEVAFLKYNEQTWTKEVLASLAATASVDGNVGTPSVTTQFVNGVLNFAFHNIKGDPGVDGTDGDAAGFGTVAATVDNTIGTPAVSVSASGPDTAKNFTFAFTGLKGATGVTSAVVTVDNTSGTPQCAVSLVGQELHLDFTGLKGAQGDTGVSADYPITVVNNLTTNDPTSALSAAQGVQLESEISQLDLKVRDKLPNIEEDGFAVADENGNAVIRYDSAGFDVAALSRHILSLISAGIDLPTINVEEDGFFIADGQYNVVASVSENGLDAASLATNLANIILALVGSPSYKTSCDVGFLPYFGEWNQSSVDSLCLCALKTPVVDDAVPFHEGFLFHKLPNDDKSFWFGTRLDNAVRIGTANFYPKDYLLAMSPTDGRVIAAKRWTRDNLQIWDGTNTTSVAAVSSDGNNRKPSGWLYNSGVDFIVDDGVEYCLFAEYDGSPTEHNRVGYYVWKGRYPYTQPSDWKTVFYQDFQYSGVIQDGTITHFHMVKRDPWTNILYLTSGDRPGQLKWWYSTDFGETWVELTNNNNNGWEEHTARMVNMVFTKDYIYWANDHGTNHTLNRIQRDSDTGIIDISTREKLADLPFAQACNSVCLVESPNGVFMYERFDVDAEYQPYFTGYVKILFWSIAEERLYTVITLPLKEGETWGGCRGKCYINYTSGQENRPAMGFADNTRCAFDLVGAGDNIGTIMFNL